MSDPIDMDAPVTRREMHDALGIWAGAITQDVLTRTMHEVVPNVITQVKALLNVLEERLMGELRSQTSGIAKHLEGGLGAFEPHYKDLPARVRKLEAKVFGHSPRRPRRRTR